MSHYIEIAEPSDDRSTWWISLPGMDGVTSAVDDAVDIASQASDALESAVAAGATLPQSIEDGLVPLYDISDYENPLVVLIPIALPVSATA